MGRDGVTGLAAGPESNLRDIADVSDVPWDGYALAYVSLLCINKQIQVPRVRGEDANCIASVCECVRVLDHCRSPPSTSAPYWITATPLCLCPRLPHMLPKTAQHSASSGPPPFLTLVKPFASRYSFAFWPRPPPPQCEMIGVALSLPSSGERSIDAVARSKTMLTAALRLGSPIFAVLFVSPSPGSFSKSGLRTSTTTRSPPACSTKLASSSGGLTPGLRPMMAKERESGECDAAARESGAESGAPARKAGKSTVKPSIHKS
mmetsp:Transcript_2051/g.6701  ORF Transcript_2051/g.6701 Transcript_2051/m.6701 type:complete len:263 (+) Transcript_2051:355-1143(+)